MNKVVVQMIDITKDFPGVRALDCVSFNLEEGEIHAIMGENGAGKSTLIKVLTGVHTADTGEIKLYGETIYPKTPLEAQQLGISTVYQEVNLCKNLSVAENIFIGREPLNGIFIDWKNVYEKASTVLKRLDLEIDVTKTLGQYPVAIQQMVAIARALVVDSKILILDEPTSSLDESETAHLFDNLRQLKKNGMSIVFISHFLDQVYELCDRATILRNGHFIDTAYLKDLPRVEMISKMLGKEVSTVFKNQVSDAETYDLKENFLKAENIAVSGKLREVSLEVRKGEVLGFAGLLGSGRTETAQTMFGIEHTSKGQFYIKGKPAYINSPRTAMDYNIALCPEDRKTDGIIGDLSVRENIILAMQAVNGAVKKISQAKQEELADYFIEALSIKVSSPSQRVNTLSGGNQQKVILARWLATKPELLILDEPTRGIDIGTKSEIQILMNKLAADEGMSVVFISSEIEELVKTCSRLAIFKDQKVIDELVGERISIDDVMVSIAGGEHEKIN